MAEAWNPKEVFSKALGLPEGEREAYLQAACPDDQARAEIRKLIQHHQEMGSAFLVDPAKTVTLPPTAPRMIAEFRVISLLGEGGMGVVYLAEDTILGRHVALKVLARHLTGSEQALARFREEARSAAALKHPGIVPVFKFGQDGDTHYLASEYVDGPTLSFLIADRKNAQKTATQSHREWHRRVAELIAKLADALDCAHRANIVHRDVKPSNVLLDRQLGPRLTDFGIAKHLVEEDRTETTKLIGSCHYMSPEQASISGTRVDQRSDIFSLGVVLYELLSLRKPFDGPDATNILRAVLESQPPRLRNIDPRIPKDLETICLKAMEKDPAHRFQTAAHVAADLRCFLLGAPILAQPPSLGRRARYWMARHRNGLLIAACIGLTLTGSGLVWLLKIVNDEKLAWISVTSERPGEAYLQMVNPATLDFDLTPQLLGTTPVSVGIQPGQYRVTVVDQKSEEFVEFNAILIEPGKDHEIHFIAYGEVSPSDNKSPYRTNTRSGVFRGSYVATERNMVFVASGDYRVGWHEHSAEPINQKRMVKVPAFYIDRHEVSIADYEAYRKATGQPAIPLLQGRVNESDSQLPVVGLTQDQAESYARWAGKRLPTFIEWQAATRGKDGLSYPWGNEWENHPEIEGPTQADFESLQSWNIDDRFDLILKKLVPVSSPDVAATASGLFHVFGNAREMTATVDLLSRDVIACGRCWLESPRHTTLARVVTFPLGSGVMENGFRCAKSASPCGGRAGTQGARHRG